MPHYPYLSLSTAPSTIVLANGEFPTKGLALELIDSWVNSEAITLVCCDGAASKLQAYTDKLPDAVVGDLDSLGAELKEFLKGRTIHIPEQDTNDLTKTIRHVSLSMGLRSVALLGASGGREDHALGNLALLPSYASLVDELVMITDHGYFRLITEPSQIEVYMGQQVSVFSFDRSPLTLRGVHWPLESQSLPELWMGTLNRADEPVLYLEPTSPTLLYLANL